LARLFHQIQITFRSQVEVRPAGYIRFLLEAMQDMDRARKLRHREDSKRPAGIPNPNLDLS